MVRLRRSALAALTAALLLAACGGGDPYVPGSQGPSGAPTTPGSFTAVVSFGDSLSDAGTYAPATSLSGNGSPPYFGGRFTTNGAAAKVWVENVAAALGLLVTPAEVGFNGASVKCPAEALGFGTTCTAYGQGGARVTNPAGIGRNADGSGALTVPMTVQIDNHLARFGSFRASDLVFVYGGNNDVFVQFGTFAATATAIQTAAAAGEIGADEANRQLFAAQTAAQTAMKQAALELARDVKTKILANGARYVAVMTLSDIADTPFGATLPAQVRPVLSDLSQIFNLWLREGLKGQPVRIVDTYPLFKELRASYQALGFTNVEGSACSVAAIQAITGGLVQDGSSLFCDATPGAPTYGLSAGASASTWFFADAVHPTTGGHQAIADAVLEQLRSFGWI